MPLAERETSEDKNIRAEEHITQNLDGLGTSVDWLYRMLEKRQSVSETMALKPDGALSSESTVDFERPVLVNSLVGIELTPNGLMKTCKTIVDEHPDLVFSFKVDDNKHSFTYTVTKRLESASQIRVGDYAQWTASGAEQWIEPRRIVGFSSDKKFAFAGDSPTGIPVTQLEKRQPKSV